ncbi:MAG: SWIM zinc finger domain-containing protein [Planctomycetes bacterium]|nr:SWIM zinc finger domain-containing protein [Planctomycetota bacterium]
MAKSPHGTAWAALTWDDLERWAGARSVQRGRSYQRGGRVKDLRVSAEGALLATVIGTHRYATTVSLAPGATPPSFVSACTCPIGGGCKHAVAVVAQYLDAVAHSRPVSAAAEDDPRWDDLDGIEPATESAWDEDGEEDYRDDESDEGDEGEEFEPAPRAAPARRPTVAENADEKIERDIRGRSQAELADLVCSLIRRFPELRREFLERLELQQGNVKQLSGEVRKQIRKVTSEPGWSNHWSDEGHTPDYTPIRHRLERLLDLGHADEVVALGRELIEQGLQQIGESNDEGETAEAFRECLPVVFRALTRSRLSGPERLLFVLDAILDDDYDTFADVSDIVLNAAAPADWSVVADTLAGRLKAEPRDRSADDFSRNYQRDRITDWIAVALEKSGRGAELGALYEREARATGSYERLVALLLEQGRTEDAERWAREGIAATREKLPGIAAHLAKSLCDVARQRGQWDVVAAHAADDFFERPGRHGFEELLAAARHAGVEEPVRAAALRFLETGTKPYRLSTPAPAPVKGAKTSGRKAAPKTRPPAPAPAEPKLVIDPAWPLPVPDHLRPVPKPPNAYDPGPRPHLNVLLEIAIAAERPDDVLHWFDQMRSQKQRGGYYGVSHYADRVAEAVAGTYPERALDVYRAGLDAQLPNADQNAYAAATGYLRKLRPIYESLGRLDEWTALVSSIREKYRRRIRFMELLDGLDGHTIVQSVRKARK